METEENPVLMRLLDEEYTRHPFYGSRKMCSWLRRQGYAVNRKRVRRLMIKMGLVSVAPKPGSSRSAPGHKVYPYLLEGLSIKQPDHVWCADITYIRMVKWIRIPDGSNGLIQPLRARLGGIGDMEEGFCVSALESALRRHGCPRIFNTDQGAQSSPVRPLPAYSKVLVWTSAWMVRVEQWITSWSSVCGAP